MRSRCANSHAADDDMLLMPVSVIHALMRYIKYYASLVVGTLSLKIGDDRD